MMQTVALAAVVLFAGYGIRRRIGVLDRFNIPAPVIGGFLFAAAALALRQSELVAFEFTTTLQAPLMIAFFTTIGLGASLGLLKVGGPQVLLFWGLASLLAVFQNGVGLLLAKLLGVHPMLGLITGSITMTGGHGTGAAFGKLLEEQYQFPGAVTLAMAAATFGLVSGGLIGGPVGTRLIKRFRLEPSTAPSTSCRRASERSLTGDRPAASRRRRIRCSRRDRHPRGDVGRVAGERMDGQVRHAARLHWRDAGCRRDPERRGCLAGGARRATGGG
jgi:sodium--glutamate symport carrier gltS